ncbi:MAG TPA: triose-phosphate isomerase [Planctomycetota bacterium]|nr:triose-phosphate isomerase [Planctomycetota bacterium]
MRPPLIAGNWKMNGLQAEARDLAAALRREFESHQGPELLVCPPFLAIPAVAEILKGVPVRLGAQDMHWEAKGAYTGEVSAPMLKEFGVTHVLLGHSERRHILGETHEMVNRKAKAALAQGLTPIVCVGELLEERTMGATTEVIDRQFSKGFEGLSADDLLRCVIAYEPVWAIGTGKTATPRQAAEVHHQIRKLVSKKYGAPAAEAVRILYGGSVTPETVKDLMAEEGIDGALVGGASLKADAFAKIARYSA